MAETPAEVAPVAPGPEAAPGWEAPPGSEGAYRFRCAACGAEAPWTSSRWRCRCGGPWDAVRGRPAALVPEELAGRPPGLWRYREALPPFDPEDVVSLGETMTPLVPAAFGDFPPLPAEVVSLGGRAGAGLSPAGSGEPAFWLKVDALCPTGSFKDRGVAMVVSHARRIGLREVFTDSSGNAGAALAAYAARAGIRCRVLVPTYASGPKVVQIAAYGAEVVRVPGTREDVARAALAEAERAEADARGGAPASAYASHNWHPLFLEGTKTLAYEVWEQLGFRAPDAFLAPMGYGSAVLGAALGFGELLAAGRIPRLPRLIGVQAAACAPVLHAARTGDAAVPGVAPARTVAEGVACARPVRGPALYQALASSGGGVVGVSEEAILEAWRALARQGWYVEPTAAVAAAGARAAADAGLVRAGEAAVVLLTGHGLKAGAVRPDAA